MSTVTPKAISLGMAASTEQFWSISQIDSYESLAVYGTGMQSIRAAIFGNEELDFNAPGRAGMRGPQILLAAEDYIRAVSATVVAITTVKQGPFVDLWSGGGAASSSKLAAYALTSTPWAAAWRLSSS
jgi:hypothetical protein